MVRTEDWGRENNCTLFVFDNTANGLSSTHGPHVLNPDRRVQTGETSIVIRFGLSQAFYRTVP